MIPLTGPFDACREKMRATPPDSSTSTRSTALAAATLVLVTLAVFAPAFRFDFIEFDDTLYLNHPRVLMGLTWENVLWAMVALDVANWHPLTWLSHMLDAQLWGKAPGPPHLVNVALHAVNALLLFVILDRLTGRLRLALITAALFALHPLRVETVAWVSERKDVLCALFFLLTIAAYAHCVRRPSLPRYLLVVGLCLLALMSKPMAVTLPFVLLLLDYWPLGRMRLGKDHADEQTQPLSRLLVEKLPLFLLVVATSLLTVLAQRGGGAVISLSDHGPVDRIAVATLGYVRYLGKMIWPSDLVILYPLPSGWSLAPTAAAAGALALVTVLAVLAARRMPVLLVGWLWFLGMMLPVIGLVQVGVQAIADRYTYLPGIGLTIAAVWGTAALVEQCQAPAARRVAAGSVAILLGVFVVLTLRQLCYWQGGTFALFQRAVEVHESNPIAHYQVALLLERQGQPDAAFSHVTRAIELLPRFSKSYYLRGNLLRERGRLPEAIDSYIACLRLNCNFSLAWQELSIAQAMKGNHDAAERSLARAIDLNPGSARLTRRLSVLRLGTGGSPAPATQPAVTASDPVPPPASSL